MEASALHAPAYRGRRPAPGPLLRLRSDEQLVARFRLGHDDAFGAIHDRYRQRLFAYTRQMLAGSRSDAEDALQDVFLRAYRALREDDRPITLRAWLYRVAHNRCVDQLRRPLPDAGELFDVSRTPLRDPLDETERREELRRLVADVRRLPDQQRSALLMRELDGLSYAELAGALDVTVPAVKSLLVRARIGLVEAGEARDAACADIRADLALACRRGVRLSGRSRRHLRDCAGCRGYRHAPARDARGLRARSAGGHGALVTVAKLLGLGGAGSGAAFGGGAAAVGGGAAAGSGARSAAAQRARVRRSAVVRRPARARPRRRRWRRSCAARPWSAAARRRCATRSRPSRRIVEPAARRGARRPSARPRWRSRRPGSRPRSRSGRGHRRRPSPRRRAGVRAPRRRAAAPPAAGSTVRHHRARVPAVTPAEGAISAEAAGSGGALAPAAEVVAPATDTAPTAADGAPAADRVRALRAGHARRRSRRGERGRAAGPRSGAPASREPGEHRRRRRRRRWRRRAHRSAAPTARAAAAPAREPAAARRRRPGHGRGGEGARAG